MTDPQTPTLPLEALRFGHEAPETINVRVTDRLIDIDALANSIDYKGVIQALGVVRHGDGNTYVAFGNRRLAALQALERDGKISSQYPVKVDYLSGSLAELLETSLAENIERVPLHPVDQYEAFATLRDRGMDEADIARRHGLGEREVAQLLALGNLAPELRDAWRQGEIDADVAKAFTLARDPATQMRVFQGLVAGGGYFHAYHVRHAIMGGNGVPQKLGFVGRGSYEAAGGAIDTDLFGEGVVVRDLDLLDRLAADKLDAEVARVRDSTRLAWVASGFDFPRYWEMETIQVVGELKVKERARLQKLERDDTPEARLEAARLEMAVAERAFTVEQAGRSGVLVFPDPEGGFRYSVGVVRPEDSRPAPEAENKPQEAASAEAGPSVPAKVRDALRVAQTKALSALIASEPETAVRLLVASAMRPHAPSPICWTPHGAPEVMRLDALSTISAHPSFAERLDAVYTAEMGPGPEGFDAYDALARVVAMLVDCTTQAVMFKGVTPDSVQAVFSLFGARQADALREAFDATSYFYGVPKALCLAALVEAKGEDYAKPWASAKKDAIAAHCVEVIPPTGWIPESIRPAAAFDAGQP